MPPRKDPYRNFWRLWHRTIGTTRLTHFGVTLSTAAGSVPNQIRNGIFKRDYEAAEAEFVVSTLRTGDRVVEIGAGIGFIGTLAAKHVGSENVTSYEANPEIEPLIRSTHALNGVNPNLIMKAVSHDGAPQTFHLANNLISSSAFAREETQRRVEVDSVALGDVLERLSPTVLIVDVEGGEVTLFDDIPLPTVRALILEVHPHVVGDAPIGTLLKTLEGQGLQLKAHVEDTVLMQREL